MEGELDDVRDRLSAIADELADLALQCLRAAVDGGGAGPVADERRLTRARRAVEKAVALLGDADGGEP